MVNQGNEKEVKNTLSGELLTRLSIIDHLSQLILHKTGHKQCNS